MCRYHWWSARLRCVCFEMFLSPAVARCPFLSCTGSPQSMWGEQRMPSSQRPTTASTSSSKSLLSTWVFLKKRPMTLEVWCDERTFPTQLKVTKEWIPMSLLESVWKCVVMFCEWAELGGGGPLCQRCGDRAIQSRSALAAAPRDFSSPLFRHAPACALRFVSAPAVAVVAVVPEGTQNSRALSLSVSFHHVKKESQALLPKSGHFLKKKLSH